MAQTNLNDEQHARRTVLELRATPGALGLCNRDFAAELESPNGSGVVVPGLLYGTATDVVERTANINQTDWADNEVTNFEVGVKVNRELNQATSIRDYNAQSVNYSPSDKVLASQRNKMGVFMSDGILSYMNALTVYTTFAPVADDVSKVNGTGPNNNAGKIFDFGTIGGDDEVGIGGDQSEIANYGVLETTGTAPQQAADLVEWNKTILAFLDRVRGRIEDTYIYNGVSLDDSPGSVWVCGHRAVITAIRNALLGSGYNFNPVDAGLIGPSTPAIFRPGSRQYGGRYEDMDLVSFSSPQLAPGQTNDAAKKAGWPVLIGTRAAVTYGVKGMQAGVLGPIQNKKPVASYRQLGYWGRGLVNASCLMKASIRSLA